MKINKRRLIAILLVAILIAFIPLVSAAPAGTSESTVVAAAKGWIGVKSVHGGNSRSGIDCSHLVFQVYKQAGAKDIVFQTVPNMKKNAYYVTTASPTPGDVIFWKKDITKNNRNYWLVSHVGIYIGSGQFIGTSFDTKTVTTESISDVYQEGMPYYARWDPSGSDDTNENDETPGNNDLSLPVAAFATSPTSGKAPLNVAFTDKSTSATSWAWSFGDGSTSAEKNPTHTYSEAGNYNVVLIVNNEKGSSSKTQNIIVQSEPIPDKILPVADFNAFTVSGYAPFSVQFTDLSQNANGWNWNFGDGATSTEQNPAHTYSSAGNYDVNLTVVNENKTSSKISTINVLEESNSSDSNSNSDTISSSYSNNESDSNIDSDSSSDNSSDSSSGGHSHKSGGSSGGGSPEPAKNVQVKEILQTFIASGKDVNFNFTENAICVESITFRSTKTVGKTTTIVEELKNKSSLVPKLPEGVVYKSFNIWVGNSGYGNSKSIENSSVNFKVNNSWVDENNINKSSIILNRYDDEKEEWVDLPVNLTSEDDQFLHFTADVPGYFSFAITGTESKHKKITVEPTHTDTNSTTGSNASSNANTIGNKIAEESIKSPGFSIISGIVCLFCIFLYRSKGK